MKLKGTAAKLVTLIVAIALIAAGVYLTFFRSKGFVKTTAEIISVDLVTSSSVDEPDTYEAIVEFSVDGTTYKAKLDETSSSYVVGKTVKIMYNPDNPLEVHTSGPVGVIFLIVGIVVTLAAIASIIFPRFGFRR